MTNEELTGRFDDRIARKARALAANYKVVEAADLEQEMWLALFEKMGTDPTFAEQTDWYILQYAEWKAKHAATAVLGKMGSERKYLGDRLQGDLGDYADHTGWGAGLWTNESGPTEEVAVWRTCVDELVSTFSPEAEAAFWMILAGYPKGMVATRFFRSASWVSNNIMVELDARIRSYFGNDELLIADARSRRSDPAGRAATEGA